MWYGEDPQPYEGESISIDIENDSASADGPPLMHPESRTLPLVVTGRQGHMLPRPVPEPVGKGHSQRGE